MRIQARGFYFLRRKKNIMKQPKKLTLAQKRCLSTHKLNWREWMLVEETKNVYRVINKKSGEIKEVNK